MKNVLLIVIFCFFSTNISAKDVIKTLKKTLTQKSVLSKDEKTSKNVKIDEKIKNLFSELKQINAKLWDIEDNKRQCEKDSKFDDHFILLSREIHFLNDKRASIKLEINNHTGSKIKEIKEYTKY